MLPFRHSLKVAANVPVPTVSVKTNTCKRGWSDFPELKEAKLRNRFWYRIWKDCDRPRSGIVFGLVKWTKQNFQKVVKNWKNANLKIYHGQYRIIHSFCGKRLINLHVPLQPWQIKLPTLNGTLISHQYMLATHHQLTQISMEYCRNNCQSWIPNKITSLLHLLCY